jgi:hypothetical protein
VFKKQLHGAVRNDLTVLVAEDVTAALQGKLGAP